ncbi:MAG: hypothetical protein ACH0QD_04470 [Tepidibacillus sp.]
MKAYEINHSKVYIANTAKQAIQFYQKNNEGKDAVITKVKELTEEIEIVVDGVLRKEPILLFAMLFAINKKDLPALLVDWADPQLQQL